VPTYTGSEELIEEMKHSGPAEDPLEEYKKPNIYESQDKYRQQRHLQAPSPERIDYFDKNRKENKGGARTYQDIQMERNHENEREDNFSKIKRVKRDEGSYGEASGKNVEDIRRGGSVKVKTVKPPPPPASWDEIEGPKKKPTLSTTTTPSSKTPSKWDTPKRADAGATPTRSKWEMTPSGSTPMRGNKFGETPTPGGFGRGGMMGETPTPGRIIMTPSGTIKSRWDQKPTHTPKRDMNNSLFSTPSSDQILSQSLPYWARGMKDDRNTPLSDEDLDKILPRDGYEIVLPPEGYRPIRTPSRKLQATPLHVSSGQSGYQIPMDTGKPYELASMTPIEGKDGLPYIKPDEVDHFSALLNEVDEKDLTNEEIRDRKIMMLLLKVKNGTPPMRKAAMKNIAEKAREFGAGPLFQQIIPLLMSPTLEEQERHLLVKVIDRILYKLDDLVRPYTHKILVVIEPLLIEEDYYARVEGREIISNLAKAAGLATMISAMRQDIDHQNEYVRNTTARAFAVVSSALGIPACMPFLKAVCNSRKSWQAKHTGIKIVQQVAILMGCAVLPHLKNLVEIISHGLKDEQQKVRTITALAISALAEAAYPYGIEAFKGVLITLWDGICVYKGKALTAFLKAIGYIIPLMNPDHAGKYTRLVMDILKREFSNNDEDMRKIVLNVVKQCVSTEGVDAQYVREQIIPEFFRCFWTRKSPSLVRNSKQLVDTTVEIASKVGGSEIIRKIVDDLKDDNENYRRIVMETIEKICATLGVADVNSRLEEKIMDGIQYAFQEQISDDTQTMLNGFGTVVNCFGLRMKPYIPHICGTIQWRLTNRSAKVRQQAADLITRISVIMKNCNEEGLMGRLGIVLYENLSEEYPEVLGSILGGLKSIVNVIGMTKMTPPIKDLLPRLTPILKNRHEKVQENCIDLVGRIADRGPEFVSAREWMRICFDLLDLLNAHKKAIRRATVNTFGYIAKAIGPQDVLVTLLNNLRVQERQNRVCTTVAIAIVAETCGPFTVLPALMNEYRVPEMNVQNGVLKSLSFTFEYISEMGKDYIYAVTPLLEDALCDRDLVHRQTAASVVKHMSLGVAYLG
jgi:splicing factor 3B subunit 1